MNNLEAHKLPILYFETNCISLRMSIRIKNKLKFSEALFTVIHSFDLGRTLEKLEELSVKFEVNRMKIYANDYIFKKCTIEEFIEGNKRLKSTKNGTAERRDSNDITTI